MPSFDRRFLFGSAAAAVLPGLLLCVLLWSPDLLADAWQVPWLKPAFPQEQRREAALDREQDGIRRRCEAHQAIARELAEGRLTLLGAAARSRDLDRRCPDFPWEAFRRGRAADSDDELHCREVIEQLRAYAPLGPAPTEELALRLEEELQGYLAHGTLRLPESDA